MAKHMVPALTELTNIAKKHRADLGKYGDEQTRDRDGNQSSENIIH